ncbi:methylenetetrahydromethanopterin dehydrogenase [Candidatus Bathyarchaeota archaeon]|nr:MAG: methylenetetrahydromethanopterin dehydrogenase [Candidatus Bathyarchaeota archaeon]
MRREEKDLSGQKYKKVFIFLDTDKHASPFDMLLALDLYPDSAIWKFENVTADDAERLIYDIIFPRGPKGIKHTKIFINGRDMEVANKILEKIRKCMFPPFELSVIIDPRGAYTTASALVAKTLKLSMNKDLGDLQNKRVTVLAGTGPVGRIAAMLYASEKAKVTITSRSLKRAEVISEKINRELGEDRVFGAEAYTPEKIGEAIRDAEIIASTGAAGVQLLPINILKEYGKKCRIVADVNAVPPPGIEGLKSSADGDEVLPGIFGIGALAIGKLKNKTEAELIRRAVEEPKGIFDYKVAYQIAKGIILERSSE